MVFVVESDYVFISEQMCQKGGEVDLKIESEQKISSYINEIYDCLKRAIVRVVELLEEEAVLAQRRGELLSLLHGAAHALGRRGQHELGTEGLQHHLCRGRDAVAAEPERVPHASSAAGGEGPLTRRSMDIDSGMVRTKS